jgi:hypothetical protein
MPAWRTDSSRPLGRTQVGVGVGSGVGAGVGSGVGVGVGVGGGVGATDGAGVAVGTADPLGLGVDFGVGLGVGFGVGFGVDLGVAAGAQLPIPLLVAEPPCFLGARKRSSGTVPAGGKIASANSRIPSRSGIWTAPRRSMAERTRGAVITAR